MNGGVTTVAADERNSHGLVDGDATQRHVSDPIEAALNEVDRRIDWLRGVKRSLASVARLQSIEGSLPFAILARGIATLENLASGSDAAALLPGLLPAATAASDWLKSVRVNRANVPRRREALANLAGHDGWLIDQTGTTDYVGPFELRHTPDSTTVRFGSFLLRTVKHPAPAELLATIRAAQATLKGDAERGLMEFLEAIEEAQRQRSSTDLVPWPQLLEAAVPDAKQRKRLAKVMVFRLALLLSGRGPSGWRLTVIPPTLSEQRRAIVVPRLDQPNAPVRVFRVRLSR